MDTYPERERPTLEAPRTPMVERERPARPASPPAQRRSKADALRIAGRIKRGAAVVAMLGFSAFGVSIGSHLLTTTHTTASTTHATTTSGTSSSSTSSSSSSSSSGGFLNQSSSGSSFSSSSASSSPATSTGVS